MRRSRAFYRKNRLRAISRKSRIIRNTWWLGDCETIQFWNPVRIGMLSKGKVHCSCWMCRRKSYDELSHADKKKKTAQEQRLEEMTIEEVCAEE